MKFSVALSARAIQTGWLGPAVMFAAIAFGMATPHSARADQPVSQDAVINAIATGRDASVLLQNVENRGSGGAAVRNTNGKQLGQALNGMAHAVNGGDIARIAQAYETVIASAMLVQSESLELKTRLAEPGLPTDFETRREAVERQIELLLQRLEAAMPGLAGNDQQKAQSLLALRSALETDVRSRSTGAQVLRAASLPVRPLGLAARAPQITPSIVPSYQSTHEIAADPQDVADAPEAPLSEEILAKAKELGYDYVRIYEYVRNNVRSDWYAGSSRGAVGALRTGRGNAVDQASLLISLMRAAGAPARYVLGVAEVDVAAIASAAGLPDANLVPDMLTKAGIPFTPVIQGGRVALVRIEHTWVAAQVPYTNYRGIVLDTTGKTWLPLDVFYKALEPRQAPATFTSLGVDLQVVAGQYRAQVQSADFGRDRKSVV